MPLSCDLAGLTARTAGGGLFGPGNSLSFYSLCFWSDAKDLARCLDWFRHGIT